MMLWTVMRTITEEFLVEAHSEEWAKRVVENPQGDKLMTNRRKDYLTTPVILLRVPKPEPEDGNQL